MNHQFEQIAQRLKGLREALDLTAEEFAAACNIPLSEYLKYEEGVKDLTISFVKSVAAKFNVDISTLLFDEEPKMKSYYITRKSRGSSVNRIDAYKYQTLAGGFHNKKADIFEVTVEPNVEDEQMHFSSHSGQEFNLILEGRLLIQLNGKDLILNEGDSIYYDSEQPHGMKALDNKKVRFITVIL